MGKRHQKDKRYLTATEWATLYGGKRANSKQEELPRLPFNSCCITFSPYEHPYCDREGNIFELDAIVKFIQKFKVNPVTGKPLDAKSLVKLNFNKTDDGQFQCPVLYKQLTSHSHVVAIAKTGNVYSYQAVERLNLKPKIFKDLLTDEPFEKSDIIELQEPNNLSKFKIESFHHFKNNLRLEEVDIDGQSNLRVVSKETKEILKTLEEEYVPKKEETEVKKKADQFNAAHYSTGMVAAGFTSTVMEPRTEHEPAVLADDVVRYGRIKKKGYVRLVTNLGPLNLELFCDAVPKTCENFLKHCESGYYNSTVFHRSIRHFMIQGGDPTGTGSGGRSIWGKSFADEFKPNLTHSGRGVLSMANSGSDSNKSQFFITYRSCKHLDGKHTVFGKVVGGMDTLAAMEAVEVDNKDRPIEDITILSAPVFVDPYQEVDKMLEDEREQVAQQTAAQAKVEKSAEQKHTARKVFKSGVGKYINPSDVSKKPEDSESVSAAKKKKDSSYQFGSFSSW